MGGRMLREQRLPRLVVVRTLPLGNRPLFAVGLRIVFRGAPFLSFPSRYVGKTKRQLPALAGCAV